MTESLEGGMSRRPALQTITWLLNLRRYKQLDLDPPYQRRSVWSTREKQRFLDTVLRNYPSPAIFLHTTYDPEGNPTYHVVDGKQRLTTILDFVDNRIRLAKDYGDARLDGRNWKDLEAYPTARKAFWTYELTVEQIDDVHEALVKDIFERLNRNSRKLEPQEMRHARFDGWLITYLEAQVEAEVWKVLRVATATRRKRMADVQILSELAEVMLRDRIAGFDQEGLDALYAAYEDPQETKPEFDASAFSARFESCALYLRDMQQFNGVVTGQATSRVHLYPLWSVLALTDATKIAPSSLAAKYEAFMQDFAHLREQDAADPSRNRASDDPRVLLYLQNATGASTEGPQREARFKGLRSFLLDEPMPKGEVGTEPAIGGGE